MKYFIAAEMEAFGPMSDLTAALQRAFDQGTAGYFQVLVTRAPTYVVIFERETDTDAQYVCKRADDPENSIECAAMQQLAAELEEAGVGEIALPILEDLRNGDAQCFDFNVGAFSAMAEYTETGEI